MIATIALRHRLSELHRMKKREESPDLCPGMISFESGFSP
jgi:hypothetical protein